jgi:DNA-binding PadR family transcriptional regulator
MAGLQQPSLGAWAVLALLCEGDTHGWALVRAMSPDGDVGGVWSIRRALVYRTVEMVVEDGLAERAGVEPGMRGSPRTLLSVTAAGRRAVDRWLQEPVEHVRELRSALLLKLLFLQRSERTREPLLRAQRAILAEAVGALEGQSAEDSPADITVRAFRLETARAGIRFVDGELERLADKG